MRILFAGGGTGGHFYPIIAVAEAVNELGSKEHVAGLDLYFMSDAPFDKDLLMTSRLQYIEIKTGKRRTYFSVQNFFDIFKTVFACIRATLKLFILYPDVVFGKGGYASFPAMFAAKLLRIPVVIHESDVVPGKVNRWIADYAEYIAVSYPEAVKYLPKKKADHIAFTGQPVRRALLGIPPEDTYESFKLEPNIPIVLVLGGSQGAERINENLIDALPKLLEKYQVIHQTGENNYEWMKKRAEGALAGNTFASRYHPFPFLDGRQLRIAAKGSQLVVSRAGSTIFEIAMWGIPSILIPLAIARDDHQRENAYSYARTGAATVIEEQNLRPELFATVVESILSDEAKRQVMTDGAKQFVKPDAAEKIAKALLSIALKHD
ncbi:MAG: undecaprenyldiphospho-muramoylpentapeptide beta-N-acetylglucosaminyltransferase [Candidatus Liptonbacteria bacterium]|nr:undecaprenyldiphospho-muramoylpentapeptide beta-N-acetylglucosaminyltransferase [Candidatus Liptonbacteria bacterium]